MSGKLTIKSYFISAAAFSLASIMVNSNVSAAEMNIPPSIETTTQVENSNDTAEVSISNKMTNNLNNDNENIDLPVTDSMIIAPETSKVVPEDTLPAKEQPTSAIDHNPSKNFEGFIDENTERKLITINAYYETIYDDSKFNTYSEDIQYSRPGLKEMITHYETDKNGNRTVRDIEVTILQEPVNGITVRGTLELENKSIYEYEYVPNNNLAYGEHRILKEGKPGEEVWIWNYPKNIKSPLNRELRFHKITIQPSKYIVEVGTLREIKVETQKKDLYIPDKNLDLGEEKVVNNGEKGLKLYELALPLKFHSEKSEYKKTHFSDVINHDRENYGLLSQHPNILSQTVLKDSKPRIIHIGDTKIEEKPLPPTTKYIKNPEFPFGIQRIIQKGEPNKELQIQYYDINKLNMTNHEEYERIISPYVQSASFAREAFVTKYKRKIIESGTPRIIEVGSRRIYEENNDFNTIELENPELAAGERRLIQAGITGITRIQEDHDLSDDGILMDPKRSYHVMSDPVDEVWEIGTKIEMIVIPSENKPEHTEPNIPLNDSEIQDSKTTHSEDLENDTPPITDDILSIDTPQSKPKIEDKTIDLKTNTSTLDKNNQIPPINKKQIFKTHLKEAISENTDFTRIDKGNNNSNRMDVKLSPVKQTVTNDSQNQRVLPETGELNSIALDLIATAAISLGLLVTKKKDYLIISKDE
ncbi:G5 domain-containing protein [Hutsoniella sourekii]